MVKAYKVAGHVFHLEMNDNSSLWSLLSQYDPFETEVSETPLFHLKLKKELPETSLTPVYEGCEAPGETVIRLYKTSEDLWQVDAAVNSDHPVVGRMRAEKDFSKAYLNIQSRYASDAVFSVNNALMLLYAFRTAGLNTLEMHASVIKCQGKGFLFLAKSGTGKSTHSQLWLENVPGSELLNDDNPVVRCYPDGRVIVYGTPWSGKTPCYKNIECPVGAFVEIHRAPSNSIERLGLLESYVLLISHSSGFKSDPEMADGLHLSLEAAVTRVPCYKLNCLPDADAAKVCSKEVLK